MGGRADPGGVDGPDTPRAVVDALRGRGRVPASFGRVGMLPAEDDYRTMAPAQPAQVDQVRVRRAAPEMTLLQRAMTPAPWERSVTAAIVRLLRGGG